VPQWETGKSGNPAGKPKGTRHAYGPQLLERHSRTLLKKLIEKAEGGDIHALNILAERLWPRLKQVGRPVALPPAKGLSERSEVVMAATLAGDLTPDESKTLMDTLLAQARILETSELVKRVEQLEQQLVANQSGAVPAPTSPALTSLNLDPDDDES
jgi:hypothetical protein